MNVLAVPRCFENNTCYESPYQIATFRCGTMIRGTRLKERGWYMSLLRLPFASIFTGLVVWH